MMDWKPEGLTEEDVPGNGQAGDARQITLNGVGNCHVGTSFRARRFGLREAKLREWLVLRQVNKRNAFRSSSRPK